MRASTSRGTMVLAFVFAVAGGFVLVPGVAAASGGGGCGGPVTDEAGTQVEISDFCFSPTILRAAPGDTVTFTNLDRSPHTVLGANGIWGSYDAMKRNVEATYEFAEPGVYPYVCTWHPGMIGVVVVGDGGGGSIDTTTADGPVVAASENVGAHQPVATSDVGGAVAAGAIGIALGVAGTVGVLRFRRRSVA